MVFFSFIFIANGLQLGDKCINPAGGTPKAGALVELFDNCLNDNTNLTFSHSGML